MSKLIDVVPAEFVYFINPVFVEPIVIALLAKQVTPIVILLAS
jgi:hypothetical protein